MRVAGVFVGLCLLHLIAVSDALAATKAMECARFMVNEKGERHEQTIFSLTADFDRKAIDVKVTSAAENSKGMFPLAPGANWKIVWQSKNSMRVVGMVTDYTDNRFASPVLILDLDYARVLMDFREVGGYGEYMRDQWKYECKRLD